MHKETREESLIRRQSGWIGRRGHSGRLWGADIDNIIHMRDSGMKIDEIAALYGVPMDKIKMVFSFHVILCATTGKY